MAKAQAEAGSLITRPIVFVREAWAELQKVHPPTKQEVMQITILVLALVFFFGIFLGLADLLVGKLMQQILL